MKLHSVLLIVALTMVGSSRPAAAAQTETPSRTFLVYVAPTLKHGGLSPSEHVLSFSVPVQIPGAHLPAGPYIFRLLAPSVVQVISARRTKVYATFFTIPAPGAGDTSRERMKFELVGEETSPRIVGWYLPGSRGYEFLYPKVKRESERAQRETERETETDWQPLEPATQP